MRIWSLHPEYLDARGLVALWRETLLAQAVLQGKTRGYTHHPQLARFREQGSPVGSVADYLRAVHEEATRRGYAFDARKISRARTDVRIPVTRGQLDFEWTHLCRKLELRDPERLDRLTGVAKARAHPLFRVVRGGVSSWERTQPPSRTP